MAKSSKKTKAAPKVPTRSTNKASHTDEKKKLDVRVLDIDAFHDPGGAPFVTITVKKHRETHRLKSPAIRAWLRREGYKQTGHVPSSGDIEEALGKLEAMACFEGKAHPVCVRIAEHQGDVYLDLGDEDWRGHAASRTCSGTSEKRTSRVRRGPGSRPGRIVPRGFAPVR